MSLYFIVQLSTHAKEPLVSPYSIIGFAAIVSIITSYSGALVIGLPAYLILLWRRSTGFAIAPLVGFSVGVVTGLLVIAIAFPHPLQAVVQEVETARREPILIATMVWPGWIVAIVGITFWLIARPDRP